MLITREADYAIRTVRALSEGGKLNINAICEKEDVPRQFAYKILKKLNAAGIVSIARGINGGYILEADVNNMSLYDIVSAIEDDIIINKCFEEDFECDRNCEDHECKVHLELERIQSIMIKELKATPIKSLI